jgi:hypothetical protein
MTVSAAAVIAGMPAPASAQVVTDERVWVGITLQERSGTSSPWRWQVETQVRTRDWFGAVDLFAVRPLLGYDLTAKSSVWLGYAETPTFPVTGGVRQEHRLYQQYIWTSRTAGGNLSLRGRIEERAIESDSAMAFRVRGQVRYTRPFKPGSHTSLVFYDEVSAHLRQTRITSKGFDQNRGFAGLSQAIGTLTRVEAGYINQLINGHGLPDRMNHIVTATVTLAF